MTCPREKMSPQFLAQQLAPPPFGAGESGAVPKVITDPLKAARAHTKYPTKILNQIAELAEQGHQMREIEWTVGLSTHTIANHPWLLRLYHHYRTKHVFLVRNTLTARFLAGDKTLDQLKYAQAYCPELKEQPQVVIQQQFNTAAASLPDTQLDNILDGD